MFEANHGNCEGLFNNISEDKFNIDLILEQAAQRRYKPKF